MYGFAAVSRTWSGTSNTVPMQKKKLPMPITPKYVYSMSADIRSVVHPKTIQPVRGNVVPQRVSADSLPLPIFLGDPCISKPKFPSDSLGQIGGGPESNPGFLKSGFQDINELSYISDGLRQLDLSTPEGKIKHNTYLKSVNQWTRDARKQIKSGIHPGSPPAPPNFDSIHGATTIYNSMVHGIAPFSVRGAIWYQGESNGEEGDVYYHKMKALIAGWRKVFENPNMLFYFVQLANWQDATDDPAGGDGWAAIREAQRKVLEIPHTGMAVITDIGEAGDIHPRNKQDVGDRLAQWGLRDAHQLGVVPSGPLMKSAVRDGAAIRVNFDHVGKGLMAARKDDLSPAQETPDTPLARFAIAGADQKWHWAKATIDGDSVLVSSASG